MRSVFIRSNYWGTWSRRLWAKGGWVIELNLTPIPSCPSSTWESDVQGEQMRWHCTQRDKNEYLGPNLPADVRERMVKALGEELTNRLLTHDYMAEITPGQVKAANRMSNGGGVNFAEIKRLCSEDRDSTLQRRSQAATYETLFKGMYKDGSGEIEFPKGFSFSKYWEGEITLIKPALEAAGHRNIEFSMGERDSFGPLSRVVHTEKDGKIRYFMYG